MEIKDFIRLHIKGLKCDTEGCGYQDLSIPFEDYEKWVDKPCPKCGGNLLTRADKDAVVGLVNNLGYSSKIYELAGFDDKVIPLDMNGSGEINFKV